MQDARALLDSLMGPSRDKSLQEQQKSDGWKDCNVCKRFLVGFCPNNCNDNWFHNTRRDTGMCRKVHSERLREDFLAHEDRTRHEHEYEEEFLRYLEGCISEADAWIAREKNNCAAPGKVTRLSVGVKETISRMQQEGEEAFKKSEELADAGDVTGSRVAMEAVNKLKEDVAGLKEKHSFMSSGEEVCLICGVRGNPNEEAHYYAHINGQLHNAYVKIREKAKELRTKLRERDQERERPRGRLRDVRDEKDDSRAWKDDGDAREEKERSRRRSRSRRREKRERSASRERRRR